MGTPSSITHAVVVVSERSFNHSVVLMHTADIEMVKVDYRVTLGAPVNERQVASTLAIKSRAN